MAIVTMRKILKDARAGKYALGAFEFWSLDSAQAVTRAAQKHGVPVILQAGSIEAEYAGGYDKLRKLADIAVADVDIDVAVHLDHASSIAQVQDAINGGFTSLMIDASHECYGRNVELTSQVVDMARPYGLSVESELGVLAGSEGTVRSDDTVYTNPEEAERFVAETGIDALAVAIGTAHGFYTFEPRLNLEVLRAIATRVSIPLVLHGGSGTPDEHVRKAISLGIAKVNICTEFVAAFGEASVRVQAERGFKYSVPSLFTPCAQAGFELSESKIMLFKGEGR